MVAEDVEIGTARQLSDYNGRIRIGVQVAARGIQLAKGEQRRRDLIKRLALGDRWSG